MSQSNTSRNNHIRIKELALVGVVTAVTCVLAPLALPIGPVPISLTSLVVYFSVYVLGTRLSTTSIVVYLLIGLCGVPVFSNYTGGPQKLFGPTGGYLIGFIPLAIISGLMIERKRKSIVLSIIGMLVGTVVLYALGTAWLAYQAGLTFGKALAAGVIPFIPGDLAKIALALIIGPQIRAALIKAGMLRD